MRNDFLKKIFPEEAANVEKGLCPFCAKEVNEKDFRDELSKKEFKISGICQKCQDKVFGKGGQND